MVTKITIISVLIASLVGAATFIVRFADGEPKSPIITTDNQKINETIITSESIETASSVSIFVAAGTSTNKGELSRNVSSTEWNKEKIKQYIEKQAIIYGVSTSTALFIVEHESNFEPWRLGDDDKTCWKTGDPVRSRGLWQINFCAGPEVTDDIAFDVVSSTIWSMEMLKNGKANEWSTYRFCKELYGICPY